MKRTRFPVLLRKSLAAACMAAMLAGALPFNAMAADEQAAQTQADVPTQQLNEVLALVGQYHVSGTTKDKLSQAAIEAMLQSLDDPYSVYMSADQMKQFNNSLDRNYVGIGVRVVQDEKGVYIGEVFRGSPAESVGVQRGDYIVSVAGESVEGAAIDAIVDKILGPEGTKVDVSFRRGDETITKSLERKQITLPVVDSMMFDGSVGYIKLSSFSKDSASSFTSQLDKLKAAGMKSLIIDVRDNPGGLLDAAGHIAANFIKEGALIHTKDRNNEDDPLYIRNGRTTDMPVVMLVNGGSASASEVLTGAMMDYKLATVVGTQTFGKGSVQTIFNLSGGAALKLTIEEYLTPNKRKVNKVGLTPDVLVDGELPQLITGLETAGLDQVKLELDPLSYKLNGQEFSEKIPFIREDGKLYVPTRILAAMVGSKVVWNEAALSAELWRGTERVSFPVPGEGVKSDKGTSYVDLSLFQSKYPEFSFEDKGDQVILSVQKR